MEGAVHQIREIAEGDLHALLSLYAHLHDEDAPGAARAAEVWSKIVADPGQLYPGAFDGSALVAACHATVVPNLTRGARPYAVIENVITHPAYRRRGLASELLDALIALCGQRDCYKIMLMSAAGRDGAHALYTRLGFDGDAKRAFVMKR